MDEAAGLGPRWLALGVGFAAAGSAVSLAAFFAAKGPFGTINDTGNAVTAILTATLLWRLRRSDGSFRGSSGAAVGIGGAAVAVAGSAMVLSGASGYLLAGLVSSVGFAGLGAWLLEVARSPGSVRWPRRVRALGISAGAVLASGVTALPAVAGRFDDDATAPGWVWVGFTAWIGIYLLLPAWAFLLGVARPANGPRDDADLVPGTAIGVGAG